MYGNYGEQRYKMAAHRAEIENFLHAEGSYGLTLAMTFVLLTIRTQFHLLPKNMVEVIDWGIDAERKLDDAPPCVWGWKAEALDNIWKAEDYSLDRLYAHLMICYEAQDPVYAIDEIVQFRGLGVVKAGFLAQLYGIPVGCLDTHNQRNFGLSVEAFQGVEKQTAKTRLAKIETYVDLCNKVGGADYLWDHWCHYVASRYRDHFDDGVAVSKMHVDCIIK